jgi:DNA-binding MurR/RpiR family transcriptional regulator
MRFCRTLGFKGFQDFKIALAREMVTPSPRFYEESGSGSAPEAIIRKVFQDNISALEDTQEVLDLEALAGSARQLLQAGKILLAGGAGAGPILAYASSRFLVLGLNVQYYTEFHPLMMAAALLTRDDLLLAISHSGSEGGLLKAVQLAQEAGTRVIAILNNVLSPLARLAQPVLLTSSREAKYYQGGAGPLLGQMAIVDSLFALMFEAGPEQAAKRLAAIEKLWGEGH